MRPSTATAYGTITKTFHWLTALMIFAVFPLGKIAHGMPYDTAEALSRKAMLFSMHKTLGVMIFIVALLRILWALGQVKPGPLHPDRKAETFAATLVHWLLYGSLVLVPLTGWVHHAATEGFAPIWLPIGQNLPFVPKSEAVAGAAGALHEMFVMVMLASVALHVAGALKHVFVDRDGTLARMWFGPAEAGNGQPHGHSLAAPLLALGVFAAVLVGGAASGELSPRDRRPDAAPALAEVTSDWTVTEGTLGITTTQFGSEVNGQFADWTAAIAFDPDTGTGTTEVTIAIGTLTLGSVTAQALGADYLDAEGHPTALFTAEISEESGGYVAAGELTIKGITLPLDLPFTLEIDGDTATMSGRAQLDRRDYEVGLDQDEANLGFPVFVVIDLVATR